MMQVPVDMAVEEPWAWIVCDETYGHIVTLRAQRNRVPHYGIVEIFLSYMKPNRDTHTVQVHGML